MGPTAKMVRYGGGNGRQRRRGRFGLWRRNLYGGTAPHGGLDSIWKSGRGRRGRGGWRGRLWFDFRRYRQRRPGWFRWRRGNLFHQCKRGGGDYEFNLCFQSYLGWRGRGGWHQCRRHGTKRAARRRCFWRGHRERQRQHDDSDQLHVFPEHRRWRRRRRRGSGRRQRWGWREWRQGHRRRNLQCGDNFRDELHFRPGKRRSPGGTNGAPGSGISSGRSGNKGGSQGGNIANVAKKKKGVRSQSRTPLVAPALVGNGGFGTIIDGGFNISADRSIAFKSAKKGGTSLGKTDPKAGDLAQNGGPTETIAIFSNSPAD